MIRLAEFAINPDNVTKVVDRFIATELPRLVNLEKYYSKTSTPGQFDYEESKKNKAKHAYARYITVMQTGYFMGINIKHKASKDGLEYLEYYKSILDDNFEQDINYELAKSASIYGHAAELIYQNEQSNVRFKKIDTKEVIPVFSTSIEEFLQVVIRYYQAVDINGKSIEIAEVYDKHQITSFTRRDKKIFEAVDAEPTSHKFDEIPIIIYKNNEEMMSDFEDVLDINDLYDGAQNNTANDVDYFNDAYMVISGANDLADADDDDEGYGSSSERTKNTLKKSRVMYFPDGGEAKFLVKDINDAATENYKNRLNADIHKFSMTPDLSDEQFAGNLSGIAIKFKTIPLEQSATQKENKFRVGFRKRRELITSIINKLKNKDYDYRQITEEFKRNLPVNTQELTNTVLACAEYISNRTLLELLPQIDDVEEELRRIEEEQDEYDKKDYNSFEDDDIK